jgi:hypothetical protein
VQPKENAYGADLQWTSWQPLVLSGRAARLPSMIKELEAVAKVTTVTADMFSEVGPPAITLIDHEREGFERYGLPRKFF